MLIGLGDVDSENHYACLGAEYIYEILYLLLSFAVNLKLFFKKVLKKKKKEKKAGIIVAKRTGSGAKSLYSLYLPIWKPWPVI